MDWLLDNLNKQLRCYSEIFKNYTDNSEEKVSILEKNILAFVLCICFILSQLFWYNPVRDSFIHKMDARVAKLNAFLFISYTLFYKNLSGFVLFLSLLLGVLTTYAFYRSNYYSCKEWCCDEHLFNHGLIHIAAFFSMLLAFI